MAAGVYRGGFTLIIAMMSETRPIARMLVSVFRPVD
jgi:hypothetical protein